MSGAATGYFDSVQHVPGSWVPQSSNYELELWTGDFKSHGGVGRTAWSTFSNPVVARMRIENVGSRRICRPVPAPPGARPNFANWGVGARRCGRVLHRRRELGAVADGASNLRWRFRPYSLRRDTQQYTGTCGTKMGKAKSEDELGCGQTSSWQQLWLPSMRAAS